MPGDAPHNLYYRPGRIEFPGLVKLSPFILRGQVELVTSSGLALIEVKEAFKGRPARYLPFHVGTDRNRVFELSPEMECLFFMEPDEEEPTHYVDVWSGRGIMPITTSDKGRSVKIFTATVIMNKKIKILKEDDEYPGVNQYFDYKDIIREICRHKRR